MFHNGERAIIADPGILSESHLPSEISSRESQIKEIGLCLGPVSEGWKPMNCILYGKPGTGKTTTTRWILKHLEKKIGARGLYINCWENPTCFAVLDCMARELKLLGAEKLSTSFRLERIKRHISSARLLIVLDEIDQVPPRERDAILYNLSDLPTSGLICICNSSHIYYELEERVRSRLNPALIFFDLYSREDLQNLLSTRSHKALLPGTCSDYVLKEITTLAGGDARIAIQTLKNASYIAEKEREDRIGIKHIQRAWHSAKSHERSFHLSKLTDHHCMLHDIISRNNGILSGDLWRLYLKACDERNIEPIAERTFSEYCNKLVDTGLVQVKRAAIKGKVREFRAVPYLLSS